MKAVHQIFSLIYSKLSLPIFWQDLYKNLCELWFATSKQVCAQANPIVFSSLAGYVPMFLCVSKTRLREKHGTSPISLSIFCILILCQSCQEATDWDYQTGDNDKLVVDAIITNQAEIQEVKLSQSFNDINGSPTPASGALVSINNGQNNFLFPEVPSSPGTYQIGQVGAAQLGTTYELTVEWNNQTYTASNSMVQVFPLGNPTFEVADNSGNLKLASTPDIYSTVEQAMYQIDIDWSAISSEPPNKAKQIFYTFKTIDVNELFKPEPTEVHFPRGSQVIVTKFGLNDDFADYLRALVMETEWQGSVFDEEATSLPTNISGDGLGYFGVCAVRRDTFIAE